MDIPILKYLDILIGLAVVMVLGTTVVGAVTQLFLSSLYFRARTLSTGLQGLIRQLDPSQLDATDARLIAEMILRHPILARPSGTLGKGLNWLHNLVRHFRGLPSLPGANPTDVVQRTELVMILMEWAANQGALAQAIGLQVEETAALKEKLDKGLVDKAGILKWVRVRLRAIKRALAHAAGLRTDRIAALRVKLLQVLVNNGIGDPAGVLKAVRLQALENERTSPALPAHVWWNSALLQEAASDLVGKINQGFDNAMTRVAQAFKLKANVIACMVSLVVAFSIQLDSLSLLRRLSVDDKFRDSLVKEAGMITERLEKAEAKAKSQAPEKEQNKEENVEEARAKQEVEKARAAREEIDATLAFMREPRFSIIPDTLYWKKLAQGTVCPVTSQPGPGVWNGTLQVGPQTYTLAVEQPLNVENLEKAIGDVKAPVYLYRLDVDRKCLLIVARSPAISPASLKLDPAQGSTALRLEGVKLGRDREGARRRFPGVALSWILLSLGTPFWFNLLKNLLSFRSALTRKDDKERTERESLNTPPKTAAPETPPPPTPRPA